MRRPSRRRPTAAPPALVAALALLLALITPTRAHAAPIRLWHAQRDAEAKALDAILATWKGAEVEVLYVPYDAYATKLQAAIPLGDGPDLFITPHDRIDDFRARKIIAPVGDALESASVFQPLPLSSLTLDGELFGLPIGQKCLALFMNTALVQEPPADFESIAELAGKLPQGVYPLVYIAESFYFHMPILAAFGGGLIAPGDQFGFVGPAAERSVDFVRSLIVQKVVPADASGALVNDLFNSGRAAFMISGPWFSPGEEVKKHFRVVPLPKLRGTGLPMRPFLSVDAVMFSPQGAARPEVRQLARLLAGAEASRIRLDTAQIPPARGDVSVPPDNTVLSAFAAAAKVTVPTLASQAMRSAFDPADRAIRKVLRGDAPASVALPEAKHRFDNVRLPLPPPASPAPAVVLLGLLCLGAVFAWVRAAREGNFARELRRSLPAYRYVLHAVFTVGLLVVVPLVIGAGTSLFAGREENLRYVGFANFVNILTARGEPLLSSGSFYLVLAVTLLWTVVNVFFHVTLGAALALLLHRPTLRFRAGYRVLLILPWAVPSYVTALMWKGMFHRQYGAVTGLIEALNSALGTSIEPISWFASFSTAFAANVATNVWLGFPFMMVVTLGALTGVPDDVLEAATVDGATRWQRLRLVVLPMIRPTLAPAVTLGSVWTFNMFNVIFLVSGGEPDGTTEILVSEAYRWAFTREAQYGYAAAYSVLIFLLLMVFTRAPDWIRSRRNAAQGGAAAAQGGAAHAPAPGGAAAHGAAFEALPGGAAQRSRGLSAV